jgi:hypothetical protein
MSDKYILNGHTPVATDDVMAWGRMFEDLAARVVAFDKLPSGVRVSTVFLGLDHSFGDGPPLLFETMIFEGPHDQYQDRCSTWEQAETMHAAALALATKATP